MTAPFCRTCAEELLGSDVIEHIRRLVDEAPPLSAEQKTKLRALFATARRDRPAGREEPRSACGHD